ncbi:MAG: hypothetical protein U0168_11530 [Nannocystaceae bacterium]
MNRLAPTALILALATVAPGCDLVEMFDDLEHPRTLVSVAVTHHATAQDGSFPYRGGDGEMRVFDTDEGWSVTLLGAYVTTTAVVLHRCDDANVDLELYRGPFAEDFRREDLDMFTLGGVDLGASSYCSATVTYGPYPQGASMNGLDPEVEGATFYLDGGATKGDVTVPFTLRSDAVIAVEVDLSQVQDGGPLVVHGGEDFPIELVVSKTYDRFFDAVDFEVATTEELQVQVAAALELETRADLDAVSP